MSRQAYEILNGLFRRQELHASIVIRSDDNRMRFSVETMFRFQHKGTKVLCEMMRDEWIVEADLGINGVLSPENDKDWMAWPQEFRVPDVVSLVPFFTIFTSVMVNKLVRIVMRWGWNSRRYRRMQEEKES
jgi:hypothetical protein